MSLIAKGKYIGAKILLIQAKLAPILSWYEDMKAMGLDKLAELADQIQQILAIIHEYDQQVNGLINLNPLPGPTDPNVTQQVKTLLAQPGNKIGPKGKDALLAAARNLDRFNKKLADLKLKLIAYRTDAVNDISDMLESSMKGISGIDFSFNITPPDPITGEGGSIEPEFTGLPSDESSDLVDDTLKDETTIVNSQVVVTGTAGPYPFTQVTGTGIAQGIQTL